MKYLCSLGAVVLLFIASCKKEETLSLPALVPIPNYMPLAIGNYWVYQDYKVDTLGNEELLSTRDSLYISRDTLINGNTYFVLEGSYFPTFLPSVVRDSSGYLINNLGDIQFSSVNFTDTLFLESDSILLRYKVMDSNEHFINVPAGNFTTIDAQTHFEVFFMPEDDVRRKRTWHLHKAAGVGTVMETYSYASQYDHIEKRLVNYHIED